MESSGDQGVGATAAQESIRLGFGHEKAAQRTKEFEVADSARTETAQVEEFRPTEERQRSTKANEEAGRPTSPHTKRNHRFQLSGWESG